MINLFKKNLYIIFSFILLSIGYSLYSNEEITKEYFYNIFGGGKEKIIVSKGDINSIDINYVFINIDLFDNFSNISATYKLKNNGEDAEILFAFPKIDANVNKIKVDKGNKKIIENKIIKGDYLNFSFLINKELSNYFIKETDQIELNLPYKIGNYLYQTIINKNKEKIIYEEMIDSYYYTYSWYMCPVNIKKEETKVITILYTAPHYYNVININNSDKITELEDPALVYLSTKNKISKKYISEKIFIYNFNTSYSDKEKSIDKLLIKVKAHIIDQDYLKIFPINYKNIGNNYYWVFKNFKATPVNNFLIKISPYYSKETINPLSFVYKPAKKIDGIKSYYEINKSNNEIILEYKSNNNESIKVNKIRIFPDYYESKFDLNEMNKPLLIEIEFSNNSNFSNSTKVIEKIRNKEFIRLVKRRSYVEIYNDDEISCKFIKIKILNTSNEEDIVKISDIQVLK